MACDYRNIRRQMHPATYNTNRVFETPIPKPLQRCGADEFLRTDDAEQNVIFENNQQVCEPPGQMFNNAHNNRMDEVKKELDMEPEAAAALAHILAIDDNDNNVEENPVDTDDDDVVIELIDGPFPQPTKTQLPDGFVKRESDVFSGDRIYRQVEVNSDYMINSCSIST